MDYISVEDAIALPGLRLVLTRGTPGPWGQAVKAIFHLKNIPYVAAAQEVGEPNEALQRWTNQNSAPVAVYNDERPRTRWNEILLLGERLSPEPRLIPNDSADRAMMFGLCHELCEEDGLGWNRREILFQMMAAAGAPREVLVRKYSSGYESAHIRQRIIDILKMLTARLQSQQAAGSAYLVGMTLSAADIYWAAFSILFAPPPPEICPMTDGMRAFFATNAPEILAALDPQLIAHRDRIFSEAFALPMSF
jgi:glutathione S-transferase